MLRSEIHGVNREPEIEKLLCLILHLCLNNRPELQAMFLETFRIHAAFRTRTKTIPRLMAQFDSLYERGKRWDWKQLVDSHRLSVDVRRHLCICTYRRDAAVDVEVDIDLA